MDDDNEDEYLKNRKGNQSDDADIKLDDLQVQIKKDKVKESQLDQEKETNKDRAMTNNFADSVIEEGKKMKLYSHHNDQDQNDDDVINISQDQKDLQETEDTLMLA